MNERIIISNSDGQNKVITIQKFLKIIYKYNLNDSTYAIMKPIFSSISFDNHYHDHMIHIYINFSQNEVNLEKYIFIELIKFWEFVDALNLMQKLFPLIFYNFWTILSIILVLNHIIEYPTVQLRSRIN